MTIWVTADTHFGHARIIDYCKRPFKSVEEMNEKIINKFNSKVKDGDIVYVIGDFCFKAKNGIDYKHWLNRLNGTYIFILGNHDYGNGIPGNMISAVLEMKDGQQLFLIHNPEEFNPAFKINLTGHVHKKWHLKKTKKGNIIINVGVDVNNFEPINYETIKELIKNV
jgi:calcineurin-like phosphoesterase family protein